MDRERTRALLLPIASRQTSRLAATLWWMTLVAHTLLQAHGTEDWMACKLDYRTRGDVLGEISVGHEHYYFRLSSSFGGDAVRSVAADALQDARFLSAPGAAELARVAMVASALQ